MQTQFTKKIDFTGKQLFIVRVRFRGNLKIVSVVENYQAFFVLKCC